MAQVEPKTPEKTVGEMIPQPHGGALRYGNPGNKGGPGVPKSAIRLEAQETFRELLKRIKSRMGKEQGKGGYSPNEEIKAAELMLKAGMGEVKDVSLDKEQFLSLMSEAFSEWAKQHEVQGADMLTLYDMVVSRLKDV